MAGVKEHRSYRHEALLCSGLEEFLAVTVPFVSDGLEAEQQVMVALPPSRRRALQEALGPVAEEESLHFVDMAALGNNPAKIIAAWRDFAGSAAGHAVRGIGEPIWLGRRPSEIAECQLHEALLNLAIAPDTPLWLLCPYDVDNLPPEVIHEAARSHPALVQAHSYRGSTVYGGRDLAEACFTAALDRPSVPVQETAFGPNDLGTLRSTVRARCLESGIDPTRANDLALAMFELAANSVAHGGGHGVLRVWSEADALVCEVSDSGHITDLMVGRSAPATAGEVGRGLWLVNHLCDLVQLRSNPGGTTIRTYTWLEPDQSPQ